MKFRPETIAEYLASLSPEDRAETLARAALKVRHRIPAIEPVGPRQPSARFHQAARAGLCGARGPHAGAAGTAELRRLV